MISRNMSYLPSKYEISTLTDNIAEMNSFIICDMRKVFGENSSNIGAKE